MSNDWFSRRRRLLLGGLTGAFTSPAAFARLTNHESRITPFAPVVPGYVMRFPHDEGAHPEFRVEWWYVTGWVNEASRPLGFQITFFRARPQLKHDNPSAFAPRQIMIGHAALSDPARRQLIHAQRAARAGLDVAGADEGRARVWIDEWRLDQESRTYRARIPTREFSIDLVLDAVQPPLLQGENGFSRKGPASENASYYYSLPHLEVGGTIAHEGRPVAVTGSAWLDHEWSSSYLAGDAAGWDWIGINLDGGAALMAFRMRGKKGGHLWAGGALRHPDGRLTVFSPEEVRFIPRREWRSARTGTIYPVSFLVRAGDREYAIEPLFDDQEHDARATTGTIYWEGAVRALRNEKTIGRGYLELTGYWRRPEL